MNNTLSEAPAGQKADIKELSEIMLLLGRSARAVERAHADDGRISIPEAVGMVRLVPDLIFALSGIGTALKVEAPDLSGEELDTLLDVFLDNGGREIVPDDALQQERLEILAQGAATLLKLVRRWQNLGTPPKAEPVAEETATGEEG
jgi:hypothetical protein